MVTFNVRSTNKSVKLLLCFIITLGFIIFSKYIEANKSMEFGFGQMKLPATSFLGILQAMIGLMCIVMVCLDYKIGRVLAYIFTLGSIFFMFMGIIRSGEMSSLPGIYNSIITVVSVTIISLGLSKADKRAVTDFLTGLRNRRGFVTLLENSIREKKHFHVIYFEIENFRIINDNLGHKYGDLALKTVADKLREVENEDNVYVSRIGGAEFAAVVFGSIDPESFAAKVIEKMGTSITNVDDDFDIRLTLSIYSGISTFPDDSTNSDDLLKYADIAVFNARLGHSKNRICFFNNEMKERFFRQIELERIVKESLLKDYFYLVYQPQYEIKEKKLRGFETLIRLRLPDGTMISPGEFIPVVEKTELINRIDSYVLRRALKEAKQMVELRNKDITISINVSAKNISSNGFVDEVTNALKSSGFPPECLEIEITEYSFAEDREITIENVTRLRKLGIQIALDDFGTGYTSLSQVMHLPISLLKIDKSLIDDIENNQVNREFVDAIIYMGHLMNCEVISEGVESDEQLGLLMDHECDFIQGFVWGKPLEYDTAVKLCEEN
ncbi:MAG: bifunctional diguanylate cyclase/phosphodiesterase [Lachnospiraceae bacterium]|nr:bifunctional diguanylate cyclase/phosphodiesterase [Lachnospiraceae bacterium]MBQ6026460.1 bifunctional diguanylate cyclase/phosphodiesterase [Lachnospiraceae bacterium]